MARFCPVLFELRGGKEGTAVAAEGGDADASQQDQQQQQQQQQREGEGAGGSALGLPYRMVLAVATMDSVVLYDTQVGGWVR